MYTCVYHVTNTNESCHVYKRVTSPIQTSHVTYTHESCHISHKWMCSHGTHLNEPYHLYKWVMSHVQMSHVTYTHESCHIFAQMDVQSRHIYEWVMSHNTTVPYWNIVWQDSFICVTPLRFHVCSICDVTRLYLWHLYTWYDSFVFVTWLVCIRGGTHVNMWRDSFVQCDTTHSWHESFAYMTRLICTHPQALCNM